MKSNRSSKAPRGGGPEGQGTRGHPPFFAVCLEVVKVGATAGRGLEGRGHARYHLVLGCFTEAVDRRVEYGWMHLLAVQDSVQPVCVVDCCIRIRHAPTSYKNQYR